MSNPALTREQIPPDPQANSRPSSSTSQMYRLTLRAKPGSDAFRNLRRALKALGRRYDLDVIEITPIEGRPQRQASAAVERRRERHRATAYYGFFGNASLPDEWR